MRAFFYSTTLATLLFASISSADRSVSIAATDGILTLVNPSAVTVTYSVECYDRVTGANIVTGAANVTLASKADIDYESSGGCASGIVPVFKSAHGVVACPGSVSFSSAASRCGAQSPICTHNNLVSKGVASLQGYPNNFWFQASTDPFGSTWDNWGKGYDYASAGGGKIYQPRTYTDSKASINHRCHTSNAVGSPGTGIAYCTAIDTSASLSGALCCPTNNGFKSCKVTIHSATPSAGTLQSPQFKGGTSF